MIAILSITLATTPLFAVETAGADQASPEISLFLQTLPLKKAQLYTFSDAETEAIIGLAAKVRVNVFELIDCVYRYTASINSRIAISGSSLRKLQKNYNLGGERVLAILPVDKLNTIEIGAKLTENQRALDMYLESVHQTYIEIGTAVYETRCGFTAMKPGLFLQAYGITIKKFFFNAPLDKLELYAPAKGAIYAKGLSRPKKWNLDIISEMKK